MQLEVHTHVVLAILLFAQLLDISVRLLAAFLHLVCDAQARATSVIVLLHLIVVARLLVVFCALARISWSLGVLFFGACPVRGPWSSVLRLSLMPLIGSRERL